MFHKGQRAIFQNRTETVLEVSGHWVTLTNVSNPVLDWECTRPVEVPVTVSEDPKLLDFLRKRKIREETFGSCIKTLELHGHQHAQLQKNNTLMLGLALDWPELDPNNPNQPQAVKTETDYICNFCGQKLSFQSVGSHLNITNPPCSGEVDYLRLTLNVPSGVIVYSDDLRSLVGVDSCRFNINAHYGIIEESRYFEKLGQVILFSGNSNPTLIRKNKEQTAFELTHKKGTAKSRIGMIETQLWRASFMDSLEASYRKTFMSDTCEWQGQFSVVPGTYAFDIHLKDFLNQQSSVNISRIGPPTTPKRITPLALTPEMVLGRSEEDPYTALSAQKTPFDDWSKHYGTFACTRPIPSPPSLGDCWRRASYGHDSNPLNLALTSPEWFEAGLYLLWERLCYSHPRYNFYGLEVYNKSLKFLKKNPIPQQLPPDLKEFVSWLQDHENTLKWVTKNTNRSS